MTYKYTPSDIEILPEHIIDQIKAGEVLERPASLLKELIENSLDAGSTEIHLHLIENGMTLLSIEDNGHGIDFKNLPYAFLRHATSKLKTFEDLYHLHSFGFRGEALASVAASARVTCHSQPKDLDVEGGKIIINGGITEILVAQKSKQQGTAIYIKDLFFNTPARLKFIKSKASEKSALKKIIYSFVLSHPQVTFTIKWDEKDRERFKAVSPENNQIRISQVYFSKVTDTKKIIFSQQEYEGYQVKIYFTPDTFTTPQHRHHYLFINKRLFQDKSLHQTILRNLEPLWNGKKGFGESGHYLVEITAPPEEIDVNVHPNKTQIKFSRSDIIYSLLVSALKNGIKDVKAEDLSPPPFTSPPSFFSKDEKQNFELLNMEGGHLAPSSFISPRMETNNFSSPLPRFQIILKQYLLTHGEKYVLIDLKKFVTIFIGNELLNFLANDEYPGPLLISEPFKISIGKIDLHFEELKSLGFEFDRLNSEYIILRTIPHFLPQIILSFCAQALIQYFSQSKISHFEITSFIKYFSSNFPMKILEVIPPSFIEKSLPKNLNDTDLKEYQIELTPECLESLF